MNAQLKNRFKVLQPVVVVLVCCLLAGQAWGDSYEVPAVRQASDILPKEMVQGKRHRISEAVLNEGYMHVYSVTSEFGDFTARGDAMLRRLLREIAAIVDLREKSTGRALAEAAGDTAAGPFKAMGSLVTKPVKTLAGIPGGVHRLFESGVKALDRERTDYEDSDFAALLAVSSYKRDYAAEHNVDVYSTNPVLQKELNRVAWASVPGYLSVSVALSPAKGIAVAAYKTMGLVDLLNEVIEEEAPTDLHVINENKLKDMGIPEDLIRNFLNHPIYSPRHQTVITFCLAELGQAKGRDIFLRTALNALDEEEAFFYQQIAELFRAYNETKSPLVAIKRFNRIPLGVAKNGTVFVAAPFDHGIWTEHAERFINDLVDAYSHGPKGQRVDFWITGTLSDRACKEMSKRDIAVREDVDRDIKLMD